MKIFKNHKVLISFIILFAFQSLCYYIPKMVYPVYYTHTDLSTLKFGDTFIATFISNYHFDFTTNLDRLVPIVSIFIIPYHLAHVWWVATPFIVYFYLKQKGYQQYYVTSIISYIICLLVFLIIPTAIARPEIVVNNIFDYLLAMLFVTDIPTNLLPSIHVLISWIAYMVVRNAKNVPVKVKNMQLALAIIVIISTQVLKQHYFIDIFAGIAVAEGAFFLVKKTNIDEKFLWIPFIKIEKNDEQQTT